MGKMWFAYCIYGNDYYLYE